ncbi:MAG: helix-turn-helix domain-containing protein [Kiritimatiellia bacterium]|jgi:transcriptional regulator with XRE-family HTH domain
MESIGKILKAARERRQISVADVVTATKMTSAYVAAIEADDFKVFVAPIYARGFIKLYAECVGLDPTPLQKQFNAASRTAPVFAPPPSKAPSQKAAVAYAEKPKPQRPQQSAPSPRHGAAVKSGQEKAASRPPAVTGAMSAAVAPSPAWRRPAIDWTFIARVRWPRFEIPKEAFGRLRLPAIVWRRILIVSGVVVLIIAASLAWEWSRRNRPATNACRWLAEPPAPYLTVEPRAVSPK